MLLNTMLLVLTATPTPPPGTDDVSWFIGMMKWIVEQIQQKNYGPAVGAIIMLLVFLFNKLAAGKLSSKLLPWVSVGLGVVLAICNNLVAEVPMVWYMAILNGLFYGTAASGLWSLVGKWIVEKLTGKKDEPAAETKPAETKPEENKVVPIDTLK